MSHDSLKNCQCCFAKNPRLILAKQHWQFFKLSGDKIYHPGFFDKQHSGSDEISNGGYTYYWSGRSDGTRLGGVVIYIFSRLQSSVVGVTPVDERIMVLRLKHIQGWPLTSAEGEYTRNNSAGKWKRLPSANAISSSRERRCSLISVGCGNSVGLMAVSLACLDQRPPIVPCRRSRRQFAAYRM